MENIIKPTINHLNSVILNRAKDLILLCLLFASVLSAGAVFAGEIKFEAFVDRDVVSLGQSIQLSLRLNGSRDLPAPALPDIDGFSSRYVGPSTSMSIVNGRMSSSITHIYRLVPLKTGTFSLGPFQIEYEGDTYTSNSLSVEVADSQSGDATVYHSRKSRNAELKDRLFLTIEAEKENVYVNEAMPVTITLYVSGISVKDIQYPEFAHEGLSAEGFAKPRQYQKQKDGVVYDVVEFKTTIFGARAGTFRLGPATMGANLAVKRESRRQSRFDSFFGNDPFDDFLGGYEKEPVNLSSEEITIEVMSLPKKGRPLDYSGAVGIFDFNAEVTPSSVKAGDPVTLKMTVTGSGSIDTVNVAGLKEQPGLKVYEPQVKQEGNKKTFEQVLIPAAVSLKKIPAVTFSFFNTVTGKYESITKGPFPVNVTKSEYREELTIIDSQQGIQKPVIHETLGKDIIYIKESPGRFRKKGEYLYSNPLFIVFQTVPLVFLAVVIAIKKKHERLKTDIGYARRLKAPKKAGKGIKEAGQYIEKGMKQEFYDSVFRTIREYIGNRFHVADGGITIETVEEMFKGKDVGQDMIDNLRNIFSECDMVRYAPSGIDTAKMEKTLKDLKEVIDHLERHK